MLNLVNSPGDIKKINNDDLPALCAEIRDFLIETILQSGGHFAGNLGSVELAVALHYVFSTPDDDIIWDVGHQSYTHKLLTGRKNDLKAIRQYKGISGFPKMAESIHDAFGTGHSSTAISAAAGIAVAKKLQQNFQSKTIAVVGDGALTGGMSFEALNNLINTNANVLVVINDNHIGIDPNNGSMDMHLQEIDPKNNIFTNLGLRYSGPHDGHDVHVLVSEFLQSKSKSGPEIIHIRTLKGKGYTPAEAEQTKWHSASPRYIKIENTGTAPVKKWQDIFGETLLSLAENNPRICGITPAMPSSSGILDAMKELPERFFDVGIAEQHAVTFAAGMAAKGMMPFLTIYSTFLQRGYDQVIHDVALQNLPVVFCIDRAGLVGEDGPTHHGVFDIAFLRPIPNIDIYAPMCRSEFEHLLYISSTTDHPVAIRYPKGQIPEFDTQIEDINKPFNISSGSDILILSTGLASQFAREAVLDFKAVAECWHVSKIKPIDSNSIAELLKRFKKVITVEDGCVTGGFGDAVLEISVENNLNNNVTRLGVPDSFIPHGDNSELYHLCAFSSGAIKAEIKRQLNIA